MRMAFLSYLRSDQHVVLGTSEMERDIRVRTWRCKCSRRAKSRLQCGQGNVLLLAPVAFLLRRPALGGLASMINTRGWDLDSRVWGRVRFCGEGGAGEWGEGLFPILRATVTCEKIMH
jgi:hypothetical protein